MRSVVVVLPASMWALIPMFLVRSNGYCLGICSCSSPSDPSPLEMGEGLVGLGHLVRVFLLLHRVSLAVGRGDELRGQLLRHRLVLPVTRVADQPADRQRDAA